MFSLVSVLHQKRVEQEKKKTVKKTKKLKKKLRNPRIKLSKFQYIQPG